MTISLFLTLLFGVISLALMLGWAATKGNERSGARLNGAFPVAAIFITAIFFALSLVTIVPTKSIGVVTTFGKPVGTLSNGLHLKAPWQNVKKLDGKIQTNNRTGSDSHPTGDDKQSCTDIRIGNGSTACVDNSIRWRIKQAAGEELFRDYQDMGNITDSLVSRELKAALNEVLGEYNPLDQIKATGDQATVKPNLDQFGKDVTQALQERVGDQIEVLNVIIPIIRFDSQTQSKINLYQAEVANTRIAQQREQTALAQAKANENLKTSVSNNPNVLVSQCFDTLQEMVKEKQTVPIGFSCWPGGSASTVVVPQK